MAKNPLLAGGRGGGNSDRLTSGKCLHAALLKTLPGQHPLKSGSVTPALQALLFLEVSCLIIKNACESCLHPPPPKPGTLRNISISGGCFWFFVLLLLLLFVVFFLRFWQMATSPDTGDATQWNLTPPEPVPRRGHQTCSQGPSSSPSLGLRGQCRRPGSSPTFAEDPAKQQDLAQQDVGFVGPDVTHVGKQDTITCAPTRKRIYSSRGESRVQISFFS